jgi:hypothetical protein
LRPALRLLVGVVALLAIAGHVAFWYLPRERTAEVDPGSPAGELFIGGQQRVRVWLPYPHQNLAAAARAMDDPATAIAAAARLAGLGEIALPAFGPFALPPSDALAIAVGPGGRDLAVTVEVFPAVALLARVAGAIARNPILRGGSVVVSGRRMRVAWRGRSWSLAGEDGAPDAAAAIDRDVDGDSVEGGAPGEALGFVTLAERQGAVEPGTYRLHRDGRDLVLVSSTGGGWEALAELAEEQARQRDLAFLGLRAKAAASMSVLVLPRTGGSGLRLPDAAVAWVGDGEDDRWPLPGERILRLLGIDPLEGSVGAWQVLAMDRPSLEIAARLAPELGETAGAARASLVIWVRPRDYLPLVSAIADVLDALPIAPPDEVEHWRDLETVLEALGPIERVRATVAAGGGEARLGWGER